MKKMDLPLIRSKFRGTMLGVLAGDCLGSPYEGDSPLSTGEKLVLQKSLDKLEGPSYKAPVMKYTDDSAMSKAVAESLAEKEKLSIEDLAIKFVKAYFREPHRGYGPAVVTVFQKLRGSRFSNLERPALEQFNGRGSWGNGGAMRVAPISLFFYKDYDKMIDAATQATRLTHTNKIGVDGALLQAAAVQQSLDLNPAEKLDEIEFINTLINKMDNIEFDQENLNLEDPQPFKTQLSIVKKLLSQEGNGPNDEQVVTELGNNVEALYSVPTAIYCFLRGQNPIEGIQSDNPFRRSIQYAITLGGDTDTIGSMAGAIAGAYYGEENINSNLSKHLEESDTFRNLGDLLFDSVHK
ncbi:ADP-ribosylhydrolase ARH3-like [Prorops nasuta]|uniref:ADP-ribosylhydrolase ARH3-like n=1 Tax=Prorops nasuta TaxID=863751 RepID=UPI0034CD3D44